MVFCCVAFPRVPPFSFRSTCFVSKPLPLCGRPASKAFPARQYQISPSFPDPESVGCHWCAGNGGIVFCADGAALDRQPELCSAGHRVQLRAGDGTGKVPPERTHLLAAGHTHSGLETFGRLRVRPNPWRNCMSCGRLWKCSPQGIVFMWLCLHQFWGKAPGHNERGSDQSQWT